MMRNYKDNSNIAQFSGHTDLITIIEAYSDKITDFIFTGSRDGTVRM